MDPALRLASDDGRKPPRKFAFTVALLNSLKSPAAGRTWVYDTKAPGLAFMVTDKGARAFYLYRRVQGRPERIRIGGFPDLSIEQARKLAAKLNADIAQGQDPQAERRRAREEWTLEVLFQHYLDTHAKLHKKTWEDDQAQFDRYLDGWKNRRINAIREEDVRSLHTKIGKDHGQYAANRVLALLSTVFNHAKLANPGAGVRKFREKSRDRFLQPDELPRFFAALDQEANETVKDFIYMALWTGARRSNVQAMRWDELNLDQGTWRIPETKNTDPLLTHLPAPAVEILKRRNKEQREAEALAVKEKKRKPDAPPCPWVFPARHGKSGHLTEPKAAWAAILKRAKIENLRIHDLRRTMGSWQAAIGSSLPVIGKSLGHRTAAATQIYARLQLDPVRQSVNAATEAMLNTVEAAKAEEAKKKQA